jgi:TatD DNase family protein
LLIDTHCHLNLAEHFPNPDAEVAHAATMDVRRIVVVGIDLESSKAALELADRFEAVYAVVGIHPNHSAAYRGGMLDDLRKLLRHPKAVALGEIGLDYHWDFASREQQVRALADQLDLAHEVSSPVVFHCREAYADLLDLLETRSGKFLLHCFSGDLEHARRAVAMDCYFGVDGPITYKNAAELREIVRSLPRDRVVIETDAPYLTPVPHRGEPNRPGYVSHVNAMLSSLWEISVEEAAKLTTANAASFFSKLDF